MNKITVYPKVLIVGRTNVGKSTLFNCLATKTKSIVLQEEGITRDYIHEIIQSAGKKFYIIDTGGVCLQKTKDSILEKVREKVFNLFEKASLILFVCDGKNGLTIEDKQIAKILHKTKKPVLLLINKSDNIKAVEENFPDFYSLGFKDIIPISATHKKGITELLEKITSVIPEPKTEQQAINPSCKITILGKPNVGKSSLMNLLVNQERSIVHEQAGTTRESVSENFFISQDIIQITDTPGIRRKSKIEKKIEELMVKSTLSSVRQSDIIILMIDSSEQKLSDQELKLLFYSYEQNKSIILVFNKTDLLSEYERKSFEYYLKQYDFIIKKLPIIWISCKNKKNIEKIYKEIEKIWKRCTQEFDSIQITELVKNKLLEKPLYHKTNILNLFKVINIKNKIPTFLLIVNQPSWFESSQLGFIENILRKNFDLKGCPIKFELKKKK